MDYKKLLDLTYDSSFDRVPCLLWRPWVGLNFQKQEPGRKLLLVGESHYADDNEQTDEVIIKRGLNKEFTRQKVWEYGASGEGNRIPFFDNIPRLFIGSGNYKRFEFWQDVVFYNFIQKVLRYGKPPERPRQNDFLTGGRVFYDILGLIKPDYCIFLGSGARCGLSNLKKEDVFPISEVTRGERIGRCYAYHTKIKIEEKTIPVSFVKHPSKFFPSSAWHEYLLRQHPTEIAEIKKIYIA